MYSIATLHLPNSDERLSTHMASDSSLTTVAARIKEFRAASNAADRTLEDERTAHRELSALLRKTRGVFPAQTIAAAADIPMPDLALYTRDVLSEEAVSSLLRLNEESVKAFGGGVLTADKYGWSIRDVAYALGMSRRKVLYARSQATTSRPVPGIAVRKLPPSSPGQMHVLPADPTDPEQ